MFLRNTGSSGQFDGEAGVRAALSHTTGPIEDNGSDDSGSGQRSRAPLLKPERLPSFRSSCGRHAERRLKGQRRRRETDRFIAVNYCTFQSQR